MSIGISFDKWENRSTSPPPVILACGPEDRLREEMSQQILAGLSEDTESVSLYADEHDPDEALREIRSPGLFSSRRFVRLRNLSRNVEGSPRLKEYLDPLVEYIEQPEPDVILMLEDSDHPYKSGRSVGSLARTVEEHDGTVVVCWELFDRKLQARLRNRLDEMGVSYDPAIVPAIIDRVEGKYARALQELKKLSAEAEHISVETVENLISRESAGETLQEFKNSLVTESLETVFQRLGDLYRENQSPARIAYIVVDYLQTLRSLKKEISRGTSLEDALQTHGIPTSQGIKKQYRRDLKGIPKTFPGDFFRASYRLIKQSRYGSPRTSQRSLESYLMNTVSPLRTR